MAKRSRIIMLPGDITELRVGDKIPADMRGVHLIRSTLRVEDGSLTEESEELVKLQNLLLITMIYKNREKRRGWFDGMLWWCSLKSSG